ncbi:MAG: hypothetical protein ACOCXP_00240 [Candidatus Dojkabacteria bacterium]
MGDGSNYEVSDRESLLGELFKLLLSVPLFPFLLLTDSTRSNGRQAAGARQRMRR